MSDQPEVQRASKTAWKKAADHTVRLPSGVHVGIRIPDLPRLIEIGEIPQNLLDAALEAAGQAGRQDQKPTKELIIQQREFTDKLVQITVTDPKLDDSDLEAVPFEDKVLIVELATRATDFDAEGHHIAGLHKSDDFRKFRGLDDFQQALADL